MDITNVFLIRLIRQMKDVIKKENERHILESYHLRHMHLLLLHTTARFQSQPEPARDILKIWFELVDNSLAHAKSILHRSQQSPISCLDCFKCSPVRLSEEIKEWKALFNYLCKGLLTDFLKFVRDNQFVIDPVLQRTDPVIQLMKDASDVIEEEKNRHILQTDLRPLNNLLLNVVHNLEDPQDQPELAREIVKIWLQLLHNCLAEAKTILHRHDEHCLDSVMCNPRRQSEQVNDWNVLFNYLITLFAQDPVIQRTDPVTFCADPSNVFSADPVIRLMKDVSEKENERHILQSHHLRHIDLLLIHTTARFQSQPEAVQDTLKIWLQLLHNSLTQAESILRRSQQSPISCLDCFKCHPVRLSEEIKEWKALFNDLCEGLLTDFLKFARDYQFFIDPIVHPTDLVIRQILFF